MPLKYAKFTEKISVPISSPLRETGSTIGGGPGRKQKLSNPGFVYNYIFWVYGFRQIKWGQYGDKTMQAIKINKGLGKII
jgi:hypothetical protein